MKEIDELRKYADLSDDDLGAYCLLLCDAASYATYFSKNPIFLSGIEQEIKDQLKYFKSNSVIKEHEEREPVYS